ncbi:MAG: PDZ domain-containing protein [Actinobacteria bacterium]|nr:PDZ domain-containing protein [Actinomycetota bacterium]
MTIRHLLIIATLLMLALGACDGEEAAPSTTVPAVSTSSAPEVTTTIATATTPGGARERSVQQVQCGDAPESVAIVCEVYDLIKTHYVDEIDDATLADAATDGLEELDGADRDQPLVCPLPAAEFAEACRVAGAEADDSEQAARAMVEGVALNALDANSVYLDSQALSLLQEEQEGEIEGIGALVSPEDRTKEEGNRQCSIISDTCRIYIVSTIEGAPAQAVGLQRDDVLIQVDGQSIIGWSIDAVTAAVRGPAGTEVDLTLERDGELVEVSITREAVLIPILESEIYGDTGYIKLSVFTQSADEQFEEALVELLAADIDRLVVDLRNNPGGLLDTAIEITSAFLPDGEVVITEGPDANVTYEVTGASIVPEEVGVVFIVNKGSASASEVVSATLQERGRATVVGENTFGKNTVQQRFNLSDGGALKLTIARWLTPGGLDFGGVGVTPDVPLSIDDDLEGEALVEEILAAT